MTMIKIYVFTEKVNRHGIHTYSDGFRKYTYLIGKQITIGQWIDKYIRILKQGVQ